MFNPDKVKLHIFTCKICGRGSVNKLQTDRCCLVFKREPREALELYLETKERLKKALIGLEFYSDPYNFYGGEIKECDLQFDPSGETVRKFGTLAKEILEELGEK